MAASRILLFSTGVVEIIQLGNNNGNKFLILLLILYIPFLLIEEVS